jgi:type 1 glutamine amidotransferase
MTRMTRRTAVAALVAALAFASAAAVQAADAPAAAEKINVLIIDGQNGHDWKATTPAIKDLLEKTGRFTVTVLTSPPAKSPPDAWAAFKPEFAKYGAVISNYCGEAWPEEVRKGLEAYVEGGGGFVAYHFAVAAFKDWGEFNKMIGMGWKPNTFGEGVCIDNDGKVVRRAKGEGPGNGHGPGHVFEVRTRDAEHPVMKGMPEKWIQAKDELYHGQRGPAQDMHILCSAYSAKEGKGTGMHEPMVWTIPYGKGRCFTTLLGHDVPATVAPGAAALLARGVEWAATGAVAIPAPAECSSPGPLTYEGKE